jgi:4-amino-4-deoxy-L-arabinose transferase-like glycosyltransferase
VWRKSSTFLVLLFVLSFLCRASLVLVLRDIHTGPQGISSADDVEFNNLALRVSQGEGYVGDQGQPTSFRAPGWPLFLAGIYWLAGPCVPLVYAVLCLLGALACVLTYLLARELVAERTARLAGLLAAIYVPHVYFAAGFLSESLFVPCAALGIWLFLKARKQNSLGLLVAAGLVLSWATLTRPFALLLWPILLAVLALTAAPRRFRLLPRLTFTLAFFACIVPWTVRNQYVHGRFVLVATNGGSTFYGGNNERVAHEFRQLGSWISTTELPRRDWIDAAPTEVEHDKREWKLGLDWLREHPGAIPLLCIYKVARLGLWLPDFDGGSRWYFGMRIVGYAPFLFLIIAGMVMCIRRRDYWSADWLIVHGTLLTTLATALLFWGSPRFRDANMPFLMLYAALGGVTLWRRLNVKGTKREALFMQTSVYTSHNDGEVALASRKPQIQHGYSSTSNGYKD